MKISTKGKYALTIMSYLARNYESKRYISLKEISEEENISFKYLEKIMISLNKNNYLDVARGNNGGYRLSKEPSEYKIGDILRKAEGDLAPIDCINEECDKKDKCEKYIFWQGLYNEINNYVDNKTLEDYIGGVSNESIKD